MSGISSTFCRIRPWPDLVLGATAAMWVFGAAAQGTLQGRTLFQQKNCAQCHFYEARSIAPSVKAMRSGFKGDPARVAAAIAGAPAHAAEVKGVSESEARAMAEWLAETTFEQQAAANAAKPKPGSPEAKRLAAQKAREEAAAKAKAAQEAREQARRDAEAKAKAAADAKAQAKRDAEAKARQEADARQQAKRDSELKARQEAEAKARADAEAKAQAKAKQEKEDLARREADAKARKDTAALDAIRRENEERSRRDADAQAAAKREAEARAKRDADERAKQEAEAKARRDAEALAQQKKEADDRARREAEAQAAAKKTETAKIEPAKAETGAKGEGGRKKIGYRDGSDLPPCPAPTGAPLAAVDEAAAKAIMERVGCPQCHAYVQKKTGPPMKNIQEKYKGDWECVVSRLTKNRTHKEEGVTDDLKGAEFKIVADFIATRAK